jgi:hypothetical protein
LYPKIPLEVGKIDRLLQGGIPAGKTSIIYGPLSSGKYLNPTPVLRTEKSDNGFRFLSWGPT